MSPLRPRLVIIDDHPVFREVAREIFEERDYTVLGVADCAAAAYAVVERCAPDVAIVDVRLGTVSGFDVAAALTRSHPSLAVLLVSTNPDAGDPDRVLASGACGFVSKSRLATVDLGALTHRAAQRLPRHRSAARVLRHGTPGWGTDARQAAPARSAVVAAQPLGGASSMGAAGFEPATSRV
jgi:DNA-binding NarL/FixJ family response regulator